MLRGRVAVAALCCAAAGAAAAGEPALTVIAGDRTAIYTPSGLLGLPAATRVTIAQDFAYQRSMTFRAVPVAALLGGTAQDDTVRITAADGFRTTLPAAVLLAAGPATAYLAIEPLDAPWPPLKSGEAATAGPFYLVWARPERAAPSREQWPYGIV